MKSPMTIVIHHQRNPITLHDLSKKPQIPATPFKRKKPGRQQFAGRIIHGGHQATRRLIRTQPEVGTPIPEHHGPFLSLALPTLAVPWASTTPLRLYPRPTP